MLLDRAQEGNILALLVSSRKQGMPAEGVALDHVDASAALRSGAAVLCGAEVLVDMVAALVFRLVGLRALRGRRSDRERRPPSPREAAVCSRVAYSGRVGMSSD